MSVKHVIKQTLIWMLPESFRKEILGLSPHSVISYAQEGEDIIVKRMFSGKRDGFFVDVGAHHPIRFSNTYLLYIDGWTGINIDAMPGSMTAFNNIRPKDINIECPVSETSETLTYYIFNEPALNTLSPDEAQKKNNVEGFRVIAEKKLKTKTLAQILEESLPMNKVIDLLSVDVEGLDLSVLKSNDWDRFSPKVILVESLGKDLEDLFQHSEIVHFLQIKGYRVFGRTYNTLFFTKKN